MQLVEEALNRAKEAGEPVVAVVKIVLDYAASKNKKDLEIICAASIAAGIEAKGGGYNIGDQLACLKAEKILVDLLTENTDLKKLEEFISLFPELA